MMVSNDLCIIKNILMPG